MQGQVPPDIRNSKHRKCGISPDMAVRNRGMSEMYKTEDKYSGLLHFCIFSYLQ